MDPPLSGNPLTFTKLLAVCNLGRIKKEIRVYFSLNVYINPIEKNEGTRNVFLCTSFCWDRVMNIKQVMVLDRVAIWIKLVILAINFPY